MHQSSLSANGIAFHLIEAGAGPTILLLHGFPEFGYAWRRQLPALAAAGFRAIAPDLRGYNLTDRPSGVGEYRVEILIEDVAGIIRALDQGEVVLVGHDWGGVIAWYLAMQHPELIRRLIIMNAPHPAAYAREMRRLSSQLLRSWYAGFFQLPKIPEVIWRARDYALLRRVMRSGPASSAEEVEAYVEAFSRPEGLSGPINYYRALARYGGPTVKSIRTPTLLIWGERDPFLVPRLTDGLERWVPDIRVERLPEATHWLHHEQPDRISHLIAEFARG